MKLPLKNAYEIHASHHIERDFNVYAHYSGFEYKDGKAAQLFSNQTYHISFNPNYLDSIDVLYPNSVNAIALSKKNHPTWQLGPCNNHENTFGGKSSTLCGSCGNALHNLVTIPASVINNNTPIDLCTCLSCLGWDELILFYKHDSLGQPTPLTTNENYCDPEFKSLPFKETKIQLTKTPSRWEFQDWALANSRENLNRIGGSPSWIQSAEYLNCPSCDNTMHFCAQFDSGLLLENGEEFLWGSGGICYAFWCYGCSISGLFWQCT